MNNIFLDYDCYILDDGRIWDIREAKFVSKMQDGWLSRRPVGAGGVADEASLEDYLRTDNCPLGQFKTDAEHASEAREKRNALIAETDYLMMPDYPLSEAKRATIAAYRQALRDVPAQAGFPRQIDWPVKP